MSWVLRACLASVRASRVFRASRDVLFRDGIRDRGNPSAFWGIVGLHLKCCIALLVCVCVCVCV